MKQFRCKGCGEIDSIVEISLAPRIAWIEPPTEPIYGPEYPGLDKVFWEAETVLGYGCNNEECEFWQGIWGSPAEHRKESSYFKFTRAKDLDEIAEVVDGGS